MYALIVYESMYGNTQQIAEAIAEGVATQLRADVVRSAPRPRPSARTSRCSWSAAPPMPSA